ncbi:MAG: DUF3179 domain-containing protein [Acidimicrobiia bacterium]|nr:DUF3179 domain-containing protein [Actinomycetota bacterium]MBL6924528.1 DUF3179 domain-containing protein [Acidimicrobiia bacterium]MBL6926030.1 DUF3179 domain-containing protein [Acidimicrobiia bacterium]
MASDPPTRSTDTLPINANRIRVGALLMVLAVVATACISTNSSESAAVSGIRTRQPGPSAVPNERTETSDPTKPFEVEQIAADLPDFGPSAIANKFDDAFPDPLVDPNRIRSGGPPPDGIPPLDTPRFVTAQNVDFLQLNEPVLALRVGGESRAYPVQILTWHEIVNDTVGGIPVSVTYCPLCNTAVAYDRRLGDRILSFGTSGMLYNSALVMYDRQTESLWSHFTGEAIVGLLVGEQATTYPVSTVAWGDWLATNPDGLVLSNDTGWSRDYGRNPYPGYDDVDTIPFLFDGDTDGRLLAKERVIGIRRDNDSVAITLENLTDEGVLDIDLAGQRISVWHRPGTASALDDITLADGRDIGSTGAFLPVVNGQELQFTTDGEWFTDDGTDSQWNVLGEAVAGPLAGTRLEAVEHVDTFWFAWAAFRPDTQIIS